MKLNRIFPLAILILILFLTTIIIATNSARNLSGQLSKSPPPTQAPSPTEVSKLQVCPDNWYKNEQPCVYRDSPQECEQQRREYFIVDGERKEVEKMDVEWIKTNCEVKKPEIVY